MKNPRYIIEVDQETEMLCEWDAGTCGAYGLFFIVNLNKRSCGRHLQETILE